MSKKQRKKSVIKARNKGKVVPAGLHTVQDKDRLGERPKKGKK